jgi:hypothetical protein
MIRRVLIGGALVLIVAGAVWLPGLLAQLRLGAGFIAKQMCSCVLVAERSLESCRPDQMPIMDAIVAELLPDGQGVRAFVPPGLLSEAVATFDPSTGCTLR